MCIIDMQFPYLNPLSFLTVAATIGNVKIYLS
jgi:hypothetical protein